MDRFFGSASSVWILFLYLIIPQRRKVVEYFEILPFPPFCYPAFPQAILINCSVTDGRKGLKVFLLCWVRGEGFVLILL